MCNSTKIYSGTLVVMVIFSKIGLLRILLSGVCMLLLLNVWLNYFSYKTEDSAASSYFSHRLNIRKVYKYARVQNHTASKIGGMLTPPALRTRSDVRVARNSSSSVIFPKNQIVSITANNSSIIASTTITSLEQPFEDAQAQLKYFTSSTLDLHNSSSATTDNGRPNGAGQIALKLKPCQPPLFEEGGPITPNVTLESLDIVEAELGPMLLPGGAYQPHDCIAQDHVAIVVPFRDRYAHLSVFLRNIHPFLMQQHIAYRIFIVEQTNGRAFNRAALMNIGYLEALKIYNWDCFIFHDVDLLPLDDRNLYNCPRQPRHMSVAIDKMNYKLPYRSIFGGVSAMTREHFKAVNGFSNSFFGWGGEDDDMSNRLRHANLFISRYPINVARYKMLKHQKEKANPKRYENLVNGMAKMEQDGLNSIKYEIYSIKDFPIFTWYLAELKIIDQKS